MPDQASLAALRAWYDGLPSRECVDRYLADSKVSGQSSRGILSRIRRQLAAFALARGRPDLASAFQHPEGERRQHAKAVAKIISVLPSIPPQEPLIGDEIDRWLPARAVSALKAQGITTLAALTLRVPRRRRWWVSVPGLGAESARRVEQFFAEHPALTERARSLVVTEHSSSIVPWELLVVPHEVDGSHGLLRAPKASCVLHARDDREAIEAWIGMQRSEATRRAYRKEAERLVLWAIIERGRAFSSLKLEDAVAYRAFLANPSPPSRWVGPARPRTERDWRPFTGPLSPRSIAYSLMVLSSLFNWLMKQQYLLGNPFSGMKALGSSGAQVIDVSHALTDGEWSLVTLVAEGLEWSYGWEPSAAQRLRFVLEFSYSTGLRPQELVSATLGDVQFDSDGEPWLHVVGKGSKAAKVALPAMARSALDRYLVHRGLPVTQSHWDPATRLVGQLSGETSQGITTARLRAVIKRFFKLVAEVIQEQNPAAAAKLRLASPHWMRHTHATHALARGVDITTVRDNLRHASISTTSIYLHSEDTKRKRQIGDAFKPR